MLGQREARAVDAPWLACAARATLGARASSSFGQKKADAGRDEDRGGAEQEAEYEVAHGFTWSDDWSRSKTVTARIGKPNPIDRPKARTNRVPSGGFGTM